MKTIYYTYDKGGSLLTYNDYLQQETEVITGSLGLTITRAYDSFGRNAGFSTDASYGVVYGYGSTGKFNQIDYSANGMTGTAGYQYLANSSLLEKLTMQQTGATEAVTSTYEYEPHRNLRTIVRNEYGLDKKSEYGYVYDAISRRKSVTNSGSAFTEPAFNIYGYNSRNELISSERYLGTSILDTASPVNDEARAYDYDPIGNRKTANDWSITSNSPITKTYAANSLNQYDNIVAGGETINLAYDSDGNLIEKDGLHLVYNGENRLISVEPYLPSSGDTRVEFAYDYKGRRFNKTVYEWNGSDWSEQSDTLFAYNGWNVVKETKTEGASTETVKFYIWGLDLSQSLQGAGGVGGLLATIQDNETDFHAYDANGNTGQLINASTGAIDAHYEYDPFGRTIKALGDKAQTNAYRFSSKYFDAETSLYYYGYRYYDVDLGRWVNRDPIEEEGGMNLYILLGNSAIDWFDVIGLWKWKNGKRQGGVRSVVIAEKAGDTYNDLAKLVRLDAAQVKSWLKKWKPNAQVCKNEKFSVPNTFIVGLGSVSGLARHMLKVNMLSLTNALERRGFKVEWLQYETGTSSTQLINRTKSDDTWGYSFFGHGNKPIRGIIKIFGIELPDIRVDKNNLDLYGAFVWRDGYDLVKSKSISRNFKYGLGINYHCFANKHPWNTLSVTYFGTHGLTFALQTRAVRYYGTWNGLVGKAADKK